MKISENIADLVKALVSAQGKIDDAVKSRTNPHFKQTYADLSAVREAIRKPLSDAGIAYVQLPRVDLANNSVEIETILYHISGQFISEILVIPLLQRTAQAIGGAITYARRYSLMSIVGLAADDDDGNVASQGPPYQAAPPHDPETGEIMSDDDANQLLQEARSYAKLGQRELQTHWKSLGKPARRVVQTIMDELKVTATKADAMREPATEEVI